MEEQTEAAGGSGAILRRLSRGWAITPSSTTLKPPRIRRSAARPLAVHSHAVAAAFAAHTALDLSGRRPVCAAEYLLSFMLMRCCQKILVWTTEMMWSSPLSSSMTFSEVTSTIANLDSLATDRPHLLAAIGSTIPLRIVLSSLCMSSRCT